MKNSWNFMRRFKPTHRSITDMAWLKLMCGLKDGRATKVIPMLDYLRTPIKQCTEMCPSRCRNSKRFSKTKWSYSSWRIFKQEKPTLDEYLQRILNEYRLEQYNNLINLKVRSQDLRIRGEPKRRLINK